MLSKRLENLSTIAVVLMLGVACGPTAPGPTTGPAKPTAEAAKPAVAGTAQAAPTAAPVAQTPAPAAEPAAPKPGAAMVPTSKTLVIASREALSFDPGLDNGASSFRVTLSAYEGLLGFKYGSLEIEPVLATEYTLSPDNKVWTFKIRPGVKFHDGTELDAEAVKYSFDRLKAMNRGLSFLLSEYDGAEVVDSQTVRIKLKNPVAPFAGMLPKIPIVSPTAAKQHEKDGDWGGGWLAENTAGTGPYRSESWERGVQHTIVKFDQYWRGWSGPHVDKVVNRHIAEVPTQRMMLERGDVDIAGQYTIDDFEALKLNKDVVIAADRSSTSIDILMATHKGPLQDVRLRRAVRAMFDYDGFRQNVMKGYAQPLKGPWSSTLPFADPTLPEPKQDLARAKELLTQAGFPNGGLKLSMTTSAGNTERNQMAQLLKATASTLGVEIDHQQVPLGPWYAMLEKPETSSELYVLGSFPAYADPDAVVYQLHHSTSSRQGAYNFHYYKNPVADKLMDDGRTTLDPAKRVEIYKELQRVLEEDAVAIHVMEQDFITLNRAWVKNYKFAPAFFQVYFPYYMSLEGKP